jgi:ElaB/YqjD/DUF883 family membrane-anchored ribosome-binding protein
MNERTDPGHPIGPEIDDSQNPTHAAPDDWPGADQAHATGAAPDAGQAPGFDEAPGFDQADAGAAAQDGTPPRQGGAGREMLSQLQSMIDTLAVQAGPVMREVAAKAAELAAVAGEKAGPLAQKAAEKTSDVGQRVAARSKVMAAELRRPQAEGQAAADRATEKEPDHSTGE